MEVLQDLHGSIAQAFEISLDNAYRELHAQFALRDAKVKAAEDETSSANEARINTAMTIRKLEHENRTLKEMLGQCEMDPKESDASAINSHGMWETYAPEHVLKSCNHGGVDHSSSELLEIKKIVDTKYRALYGEVQTLIKVSGELRTQIKRHKEKLMRWHDYINRDEFTLVLDGKSVKFQRVHADTNGNRNQLRTSMSDLRPNEALETARNQSTAAASTPSQGPPKLTSKPNRQGLKTSSRIDRYCNEPSEPPSTLSNPSSVRDELDLNAATPAATRPAKRKRVSSPHTQRTSSSHDDRANNKPESLVAIKGERMSSSSPRSTPQYREANQPGTPDLDEIGGIVETPTKRKAHLHAPSPQNPSVPPVSNLIGGSTGYPSNSWQLSSAMQASKIFAVPQSTSRHPWTADAASRRANGEPNKKLERVTRHALPSVAEDGDESYFEMGSRKRKQRPSNISVGRPSPGPNNASAQQRLQNLLDKPASLRSPLNAPGRSWNRSTSDRKSFKDLDGPLGHGSVVHHGDQAIKPGSTIEIRGTTRSLENGNGPRTDESQNHPTVESPEDEPYRARPLHRLGLEHFKINPDYNEGLDFAFDTVLRKKNERQCAPGCMRPDCCGRNFLAMARFGGLPVELERSGLDERNLRGTPSDEDAARAIADQYGKHRHNHQRPRTPPGFWRTEMPSTQDLEHDHEEARRYERAKVKERYNEAMRPGGLWKYADE